MGRRLLSNCVTHLIAPIYPTKADWTTATHQTLLGTGDAGTKKKRNFCFTKKKKKKKISVSRSLTLSR
jgi:hypothetical protein